MINRFNRQRYKGNFLLSDAHGDFHLHCVVTRLPLNAFIRCFCECFEPRRNIGNVLAEQDFDDD